MNDSILVPPEVALLEHHVTADAQPVCSGSAADSSSPPETRRPTCGPVTATGELGSIVYELYQKHRPLTDGIPSETVHGAQSTNERAFSICAVTVGGEMIQEGDATDLFPMLSIAKPFVFGLALEDHGLEHVRRKIGVEPTGTPFNSLIRHQELSQGRYNPMVNLGAIATTSMIKGRDPVERRQRLLQMFQRCTGHEMQVDSDLVEHRRRTDALNMAMAHFMQSEGLLTVPVAETLELYDTQCSVHACCADLAAMAATLANSGVNPMTGCRALDARYVKDVLSVMFSSGLYEFSGQWAYTVGLPAKSALAGSILAVIPGRMGVAVYSPPLGAHHKSARGVRVLTDLSKRLKTHVFGRPHRTAPPEPPAITNRTSPRLISLLDELHRKYAPLSDGVPYVKDPDLAEVDPDRFGICAVSVDGRVQGVGDCQHPFLLQSISKAFVYGMALEDHGREYVRQRVDVEPTGDPYDAIIKLEQRSKRPFNPMVNTGGIATTSLVKGNSRAQRLQRILRMYARYAGREIPLDVPALLAEQTGGDRNRAISYLLRHFGMVGAAVEDTLDLYLQQCSVTVTARDLAVMAATLATGGTNPLTGERAIASRHVKDLLSVMYTCGMYDFAGAWAYHVGLPAKSGVGGGIMAVVPGEMGIAVFSPPLDERGNSVRGIRVFEELSQRLGLHTFEPRKN